MDWNKWDKRIWRANGLLIFCAALLMALIIVFQIARWSLFDETNRLANRIEQVNKETKQKDQFRLSNPETLEGTDSLIIDLVDDGNSKPRKKNSFSSKYSSGSGYENSFRNRNFLIYEKKKGTSRWVFPDNSQFVRWPEKIIFSENQKKTMRALAFDFISSKESIDPEKSDSKDQVQTSSIAIYDLKDNSLKTILKGVEESLSVQISSGKEVLFFYFKKGAPMVTHYDIEAKKISKTKTIRLPSSDSKEF